MVLKPSTFNRLDYGYYDHKFCGIFNVTYWTIYVKLSKNKNVGNNNFLITFVNVTLWYSLQCKNNIQKYLEIMFVQCDKTITCEYVIRMRKREIFSIKIDLAIAVPKFAVWRLTDIAVIFMFLKRIWHILEINVSSTSIEKFTHWSINYRPWFLLPTGFTFIDTWKLELSEQRRLHNFNFSYLINLYIC